MSQVLLSVKGVSKHFGGFTALSDVSIDIAPGERFGLIGPNGSGKTTLINCIAGALRNDGGSIRFEGVEISGLPAYKRTRRGIARSFQIPRPFHTMSVLENLLVPSAYVVHLREAEAEAKATQMVSDAIAGGNAQAINYFIAQKYVEAVSAFAHSPNAKTILFPVEATQLIGTLGGIGELAREALAGREGEPQSLPRRGPFEGGQG